MLQAAKDIGKSPSFHWWFWAVIFIGLAIRIYCAVFTEGTYDVGIWQEHADGVRQLGLIGYYHANSQMNNYPGPVCFAK